MEPNLDLHAGLYEFVREECRVQREEYEKHLAQPIEDRVVEERCIGELRFTEMVGEEPKTYRFRCEGRWGNTARFRAGDLLLLHKGEPRGGVDVMMTNETEEWVDVRVASGRSAAAMDGVPRDPGGWILDESFFDPEKMLLKALDAAMSSDRGRERILPLFGAGGQETIDLGFGDLDGPDNLDAHAEAAGLNSSQEEALVEAVNAEHSYLVQGPPGTGKTRTLAQTVAAMVEDGKRVLVTAFTHRAIHQALSACHRSLRDDQRIAKVGVPIYDPAIAGIHQAESWSRCRLKDLHGGYVVGATPYAANSSRLRDADFDVLVVDEASQLTIPLAILAMLRADKFLFYGDQKQLPPVLQSVPKREAADWSIFGSLVAHSDHTMLDTTFRLNEALTEWPSENFYGGELRSHESARERRLVLPAGSPQDHALVASAALVYHEMDHHGCRTRSEEEIDAVWKIAADALRCGLAGEDIGIVTPFRRQARGIKNALRSHPDTKEAAGDITVDTVERFQGQEREMVILSLTVSDPEFLRRIADFFFQEQRWNVAVTRARSKVVIVGSEMVGEFETFDTDLQESVGLLCDLLARAERV